MDERAGDCPLKGEGGVAAGSGMVCWFGTGFGSMIGFCGRTGGGLVILGVVQENEEGQFIPSRYCFVKCAFHALSRHVYFASPFIATVASYRL